MSTLADLLDAAWEGRLPASSRPTGPRPLDGAAAGSSAAGSSPAAVYRRTARELLADLERTADYAKHAPASERPLLEQAMTTLEDLAARLICAAERLETRF